MREELDEEIGTGDEISDNGNAKSFQRQDYGHPIPFFYLDGDKFFHNRNHDKDGEDGNGGQTGSFHSAANNQNAQN